VNTSPAAYTFLLGLLPLLAFVVIDSLLSTKAALISTIVLAITEATFTLIYFGELDFVSIFTLVFVLILAAVSFFRKNTLFLKLQPAIVSLVVACLLLGSYFMGHPFLLEMAIKYGPYFPTNVATQLQHPYIQGLLSSNTWTMGVCFLFHAGVTTYAALRMGNWWWLAMRGIGFYVFMFSSMIWARLIQ